jgi:hypothetical protein
VLHICSTLVGQRVYVLTIYPPSNGQHSGPHQNSYTDVEYIFARSGELGAAPSISVLEPGVPAHGADLAPRGPRSPDAMVKLYLGGALEFGLGRPPPRWRPTSNCWNRRASRGRWPWSSRPDGRVVRVAGFDPGAKARFASSRRVDERGRPPFTRSRQRMPLAGVHLVRHRVSLRGWRAECALHGAAGAPVHVRVDRRVRDA